jgi:hypothetical protein
MHNVLHLLSRFVCVALIALLISACGESDSSTDGNSGNNGGGEIPDLQFTYQEIIDRFQNLGDYQIRIDDTTECTFYWPEPSLASSDETYPVVLWGNGTYHTVGTYYPFLTHLATHGVIVAAANTTNAGDGSEMLHCLDYLESQNLRSDSLFYARVKSQEVGATGHSQGGAGALMAGRDPRLKTTVPIQPYIYPIINGGVFKSESIVEQSGAMLLLSSTADTWAPPTLHQLPVFQATNVSTVWATLSGATHFEPFDDAGEYRAVITAWFSARLHQDEAASALFPPHCLLCQDKEWSVQFK